MSESIFVISLSKLYRTRRYRRAARALKHVRNFIKRHTKAEKVLLDYSIGRYIYSRRYDKPPRRVAVAVMKIDQEGKIVKASLAVRIKSLPSPEGSTQ
ncbi:MAG: 50S ribosomal protein L31e [Sulfolobales archaeon]|nr:60S ribosomal protein L31 [Sulfolobales archaeon]MDW8082290.1 50S ribosomal protein L31e [Sulfolobales archaeon]